MSRRSRWMLTVLLLLAALAVPARAAECGVYVLLDNRTDLALGAEDVFLLTCQNEQGETLSFSCSFSDRSAWDQTLEEGTYTVTDLCYQGSRTEVETLGYGVAPFFSSSADYGTVTLALGAEALEDLTDLYHLAVVKDGSHDAGGSWLPPDRENGTEPEDGLREVSQETGSQTAYSDDSGTQPEAGVPVITYLPEREPEIQAGSARPGHALGIHLAVCGVLCALGVCGVLLVQRRREDRDRT